MSTRTMVIRILTSCLTENENFKSFVALDVPFVSQGKGYESYNVIMWDVSIWRRSGNSIVIKICQLWNSGGFEINFILLYLRFS